MKLGLRVLLVFASFIISYLATMYAASFTGARLPSGGMEATPLTEFVVYSVFPLSLLLVLVIGNLLINRYFRAHGSK